MAFDWQWANEELLNEGYAYVGVTVQHLGALAMQDWEEGLGTGMPRSFTQAIHSYTTSTLKRVAH